RHTRFSRDWSSDVCSSDLTAALRPGSSGATFCTDHPGGLPAYEPPSLGALPAPTPPRPRFLRSPRLAIFYRPPPRGVKPGPIRRGSRVMAGGVGLGSRLGPGLLGVRRGAQPVPLAIPALKALEALIRLEGKPLRPIGLRRLVGHQGPDAEKLLATPE